MQLIHSEKMGGVFSIANGIFSNWTEKQNMYMFVLRVRVPESKVQDNKYINTGKNFIQDLRNLKNYINDNKIQIVHCHGIWQGLGLLLILRLFRLIKIRIVFHQHALLKLGNEYDFKSYYLSKFLLLFVDRCIAVSDITKDYLIKNSWIQRKKLFVLNNFVHPTNIDNQSMSDFEFFKDNIDDFKVGFAGRIVPLKDWRTFVDSYKYLSKKYQDKISYYIAGTGYEAKLLKKQLELTTYHKIQFVGQLSNMKDFYKNIDLFVSCSLQESFGLTLVEAQMTGTPVISSNIEGITNIINEGTNGLLFETGNPVDLATKIETVISDKDLRESLTMNGQESSKKFEILTYLQRLQKLYLSLNA